MAPLHLKNERCREVPHGTRWRTMDKGGSRGCANSPSIRLLKAKQELVGVTADRRVEHIFGVIIGLVCKN